jgi:hypothetical protein
MLSTDARRRSRATAGSVPRRVLATTSSVAWSVVTVLLALRRWFTGVRVRAHLRRTERALRTADTDHLDADRRRRREDTLDGRSDLVERVAAHDNGVRLETVGENRNGRGEVDGPLLDWLDGTGLTRAEAARIQPAYPSEVLFATDCGPVGCALARALASTVAIGAFAASEVVGYRLVSGLFPENPFERRGHWRI